MRNVRSLQSSNAPKLIKRMMKHAPIETVAEAKDSVIDAIAKFRKPIR